MFSVEYKYCCLNCKKTTIDQKKPCFLICDICLKKIKYHV